VHAQIRLPEPVDAPAYYVVSEALTNTAKHAQASVVRIAVEEHFSGGLGQGIREAVPEVQAGLVAAVLAEIAVCVACDAGRHGLEHVAHRRARVRHQRPVATRPDPGLRHGFLRVRCAVPRHDPEVRTSSRWSGLVAHSVGGIRPQ
jgi:hypothetical protein